MRFRVVAALAAAVVSTPGAGAQNGRPAGAILFHITDTSRVPVHGAEIVLPSLGLKFAVPDGGRLLLDHIADGRYYVEVRSLGYSPEARMLKVVADTSSVDIVLSPAAIGLDTVRVSAPVLDEFEQRRKNSGVGQFITHAEILKQNPNELLFMFRMLHGVNIVMTAPTAPPVLRSAQSLGRACPRGMLMFVDGMLVNPSAPSDYTLGGTSASSGPTIPLRSSPGSSTGSSTGTGSTGGTAGRGGRSSYPGAAAASGNPNLNPATMAENAGAYALFDINSIPPASVAGVEVYSNISEVPPRFRQRGAECGVILIWTKAPRSMPQ